MEALESGCLASHPSEALSVPSLEKGSAIRHHKSKKAPAPQMCPGPDGLMQHLCSLCIKTTFIKLGLVPLMWYISRLVVEWDEELYKLVIPKLNDLVESVVSSPCIPLFLAFRIVEV